MSDYLEYKGTCSMCGKETDPHRFRPDSFIGELMYKESLCYECAYWKHLYYKRPEGAIVVNGVMFVPRLDYEDPFLKRDRKRRYFFLYKAPPIIANATTLYGQVPTHFRKLFPNTATEVDRRLYTKLNDSYGIKCDRKGCYDRFTCLYYAGNTRDKKEQWNKLPKNYQDGWEECPIYINKKTLIQK